MGDGQPGGAETQNGENGGGSGEEEITVVSEEIIEESDNELDPEQEILYETVEESIERSKLEIQDEQAQSSKDQQNPQAGQQSDQQNNQANQSPENKVEQALEPISPPDRFTPEAREAFSKAPRVLQEQYSKAIKDLENGQYQKLRQINERGQAVETIERAIAPWAKDWAARGISTHQGIALLAETHERMVKDPVSEIARLIHANEVNIEDVRAVMNGDATPGQNGSNGAGGDIEQHPKFIALQNQMNSFINDKRRAEAKAVSDEILALRNEVDEFGNKPFEHIASEKFQTEAANLIAQLMTPPRDSSGRFTGPPLSPIEAHKRAYIIWKQEQGLVTQPGNAMPTQSQNQPEAQLPQNDKPAQPVAMRPRNVPSGQVPRAQRTDPRQFLNESVEDTMARMRANNWQV